MFMSYDSESLNLKRFKNKEKCPPTSVQFKKKMVFALPVKYMKIPPSKVENKFW